MRIHQYLYQHYGRKAIKELSGPYLLCFKIRWNQGFRCFRQRNINLLTESIHLPDAKRHWNRGLPTLLDQNSRIFCKLGWRLVSYIEKTRQTPALRLLEHIINAVAHRQRQWRRQPSVHWFYLKQRRRHTGFNSNTMLARALGWPEA